MDLELTDRVVLVTGSTRGIGQAIAAAFLREGARVVVTGRDAEVLKAALSGFEEYSERVMGFCGDLTDDQTIATVIQQIHDRWNRLDILVANIGSGTARGGWELDESDWSKAFETNFQSAVRVAQAVLPGMIAAQNGSILFVGSIVGVESLNAPLTYSAAKAALHNYAANLARSVGGKGVRVNCLAPGNVLFPGGSWEKKLAERREFFEDYIRTEVPLNRFGTPQEIADASVFLASPRASFITGEVLVVDGGQTRSY